MHDLKRALAINGLIIIRQRFEDGEHHVLLAQGGRVFDIQVFSAGQKVGWGLGLEFRKMHLINALTGKRSSKGEGPDRSMLRQSRSGRPEAGMPDKARPSQKEPDGKEYRWAGEVSQRLGPDTTRGGIARQHRNGAGAPAARGYLMPPSQPFFQNHSSGSTMVVAMSPSEYQ